MIDLKNENEIETVKILNGNQTNNNSKISGNNKSETEILTRNATGEIQKKLSNGEVTPFHKETEFVNVSLLYGIKNFPTFVKYFSISDIIKNSSTQLEEMVNRVILMVNSSDVLIRNCEWNLKDFKKSLNDDKFQNNLTVMNILQFIGNLKNSSSKSKTTLNVYKFSKGESTQLVTKFEADPLKSEENETETFQQMKLILLSEVVKNYNSGGRRYSFPNKCDINESLSKIYNIENNLVTISGRKNSAHFLRLVILAGSTSSQLDSTLYYRVMSTFNNKKNKIRAGIVNLILMENNFYLNNLSPNHDLLKFSDLNNSKISLLESTEKMNAICELYENVELEIKELSDRILDYGKSYLEWNSNPSSVRKTSPNVEILKEFVKRIDTDLKLFSDLVEEVTKIISDLNKNETRRDVIGSLQKKLEDLLDGIIISKVINVLQISLEEFYRKKSLKEKIYAEIKIEIKSFYENLNRIEKKIRREGKIIYIIHTNLFRFSLLLLERKNRFPYESNKCD